MDTLCDECYFIFDDQPVETSSQPLQLTLLTPLFVTDSEFHEIYDLSTLISSNENGEIDNYLQEEIIPKSDQSRVENSKDPFRPECKIPLPGMLNEYNFLDHKTFVRRRNERERTRVRNVNEGFERLRQHLPLSQDVKEKRFSKVETLRVAINYIKHLQKLLESKLNQDQMVT
jgi:helix-loop-helix protein 6